MSRARIEAVMLRHYYEGRHNIDRLVDILYWPLIDVVLWGLFTIYLAPQQEMHGNFVAIILGAVILWTMFHTFQRNLTVSFLDDLWCGNIMNMFSTPLSMREYVTAIVMINCLKVSVTIAISCSVAFAAYSFNVLRYMPNLMPFVGELLLFALAVGLILTGLICRYTTRIQTVAWSFALLLQPVSCVFYPLSVLPTWARAIALGLPTTHAFEGMRSIILSGTFPRDHLIVGFISAASWLIAASACCERLFESARGHGLLARVE